ncbi:MAG: AAA family ATPase [Deltaproteobacteria bacterium]|nr:AAA family ATPase [Deltaproteobacteria bacterium]
MDEVLARIPHMLAARYSLLYALSPEEERVERGIERMCAHNGLACYRWRQTTGLQGDGLADEPATRDPVVALERVGRIQAPALFVFEDLHANITDAAVTRRLRDLEHELGARRQAILVLASALVIPQELEKDFAVLDVPLPARKEVARVLAVLLQSQKIDLSPDLFEAFVTASLGLTEKEIKRAYARVLVDGDRFAPTDLALLIDEKARLLRKSRFLEFIRPEVGTSDIGGLGNLKDWLGQRQAGFSDRARAFGLPEPKGLFLLGVQGCGKSLSAKAVADLWRVPLLRLDVAALFAGRAEEGLRDTIRIAESIAPAVLWIDEIEKAFLQDQGGGRVFGAFLTWMQEKTKPVFVVATANEVRALPPELLRKGRFDEIFFVDLPNVHERLEILDIHVRRRGREPDQFDLLQIAEETDKFSGAELEQLIVAAMFVAFSAERELRQEDLSRVARDSIPLAVTMDDRLKELREWARPRARPASVDTRRVSFFADWEAS